MALRTPNDGAAVERAVINQKISRLLNTDYKNCEALIVIQTWIRSRTVRNAKKKGGLGKR